MFQTSEEQENKLFFGEKQRGKVINSSPISLKTATKIFTNFLKDYISIIFSFVVSELML